MAEDVEVGIDGSGAKKGADEVVKHLGRIEKAAANTSKRAGERIQSLYEKLNKIAKVGGIAAEKIESIRQLAGALTKLGSARGPNATTVKNLQAFFRVLDKARIPANLSELSKVSRALTGFRGPSAASVENIRKFFQVLARVAIPPGLGGLVNKLRFIAAQLAPLASALRALDGAGGAAERGLRRAGHAAGSTRADFIGLRASSLSLGGALLRTGEFASALGAAFGLREVATQINTLQKVEATLVAVSGRTSDARAELEYLGKVSKQFSVYIGNLSSGYAQFRAAAAQSNLTLADTQKLFAQVTQAVRVFNLDSNDAGGVFRAMTQIMAKGMLQMEELRGQLGDRLPIAMIAMSRGLNVTTAQLMDMIRQGKVAGPVLTEALKGFGDQLEILTQSGLEASTQTLSAAFGRLKNSFFEFSNALGEAGLTETLNNIAAGLTNLMTEGTASYQIMTTLAQTAAFLTRHVEILVAVIAVSLSSRLAQMGGVFATLNASLMATAAAASTSTVANSGLIASLITLGSASSTAAGLKALDTGATVANTAAVAANTVATNLATRAKLALAAAMNLTRGAARALWIVLAANPLGAILTVLTIVITAFALLSERMNIAKRAQDTLKESIDLANSSILSQGNSVDALAEKYANLTEKAKAAYRQQMANLRLELIEKRENLNEEAAKAGSAIAFGNRLQAQTVARVTVLDPEEKRLFEEMVRRGDEAELANFSRTIVDRLDKVGARVEASGQRAGTKDRAEITALNAVLSIATARMENVRTRRELDVQQAAIRAAEIVSERSVTTQAQVDAITDPEQRAAAQDKLNEQRLQATKSTISATLRSLGVNLPASESRMGESEWDPQRAGGGGRPLEMLSGTYADLIKSQERVVESELMIQMIQENGIALTRSDKRQIDQKTDAIKMAERAWRDYQQTLPSGQRYDFNDPRAASSPARQQIVEAAEAAAEQIAFANDLQEAMEKVGRLDAYAATKSSLSEMTRMIGVYGQGMALAADYTDEVAAKVRLITSMDFLSEFGDALGPMSQAAAIAADLEKRYRTLAALSDENSVILERQADLAYDIALGFTKAAREMTISTRAGALLQAELSSVSDFIEGVGKAFTDSFGGKLGREIEDRIAQLRIMEETAVSAQALGMKASGYGILSPESASAGATGSGQTVTELIIKPMQVTPSAIADVSEMAGEMGDIAAQEYSKRWTAYLSDRGRRDTLRAIETMLQYAPGANEAKAYSEIGHAIDLVTDSIQRQSYAFKALAQAQSDARASYYATALEATKFGQVANRSVDSASEALMEFVETGVVDVGQMLRNIQLDLLKTFIVNPMVNRVKETIGTMMGIEQPQSAEQAVIKAAGVAEFLATAMRDRTVAEQGLLNLERETFDLMLQASSNFRLGAESFSSAVDRMPGSTPGPGTQIGTARTTGGVSPIRQDPSGSIDKTPAIVSSEDKVSVGLVEGLTKLDTGSVILNTASQALQTGSATLGSVAMSIASSILPQWLTSITSSIFATSAQATAAGAHMTAAGALTAAAGALSASAAAGGVTSGVSSALRVASLVAHKGAVVGRSGGSTRAVSPSVFNNAMRYHSGGIAGLSRREVPAILEMEEEVLTKDNPRHIDNFYRNRGPESAGAGVSNFSSNSTHNEIHVNIEGSPGTPAQNQDMADRAGKAVIQALDAHTRKTYDRRNRATGMRVK